MSPDDQQPKRILMTKQLWDAESPLWETLHFASVYFRTENGFSFQLDCSAPPEITYLFAEKRTALQRLVSPKSEVCCFSELHPDNLLGYNCSRVRT